MREKQKIQIEQVERGERRTHPAFAQIGVSRVQGANTTLYGSDFRHNHFMKITIRRSEENRHLSREWHFARGELIEVWLSEAQWAGFVSSANVNDGVPCTLNRFNGQSIPEIEPIPEAKQDQFSDDMKAKMKIAIDAIDEMAAQIESMKVSKKDAQTLKTLLNTISMNVGVNIDFVARQFGKYTEEVITKAKIEVNAHAQQTLIRLGLDKLGATTPAIEFKEGDQ